MKRLFLAISAASLLVLGGCGKDAIVTTISYDMASVLLKVPPTKAGTYAIDQKSFNPNLEQFCKDHDLDPSKINKIVLKGLRLEMDNINPTATFEPFESMEVRLRSLNLPEIMAAKSINTLGAVSSYSDFTFYTEDLKPYAEAPELIVAGSGNLKSDVTDTLYMNAYFKFDVTAEVLKIK